MKKIVYIVLGTALVAFGLSTYVEALNYGSGTYGTCQYSSCSISLSTSGVADISVTPNAGGNYGIGGDIVTVNTQSSTGYSLLLSAATTQTNLIGQATSSVMAPTNGTVASPLAMQLNKWGFRIDSGAFGGGPTSAGSGSGAPAGTYAGIASSASPVQIFTKSGPATNDATNFWYAVYVDMTLPADAYKNDVLYTALIN